MRSEMQQILSTCELFPLEVVLTRLLPKLGFHEVNVMGRRSEGQRSTEGGFEIEALLYRENQPIRTIVKIVRDDVRIRNVDEVVGAMTRVDAPFAIIFGTGKLCRNVEHLSRTKVGRKLTILSGDDFARLLIEHEIGTMGRLIAKGVDRKYFEFLHKECNAVVQFMKRRNRRLRKS